MKFYNMNKSICGTTAKWQKEIIKKVEEEFSDEASKVNEDFRVKALELLNDSKKLAGRGIESIKRELPRYTYIKGISANGKKYDVQIDLLNYQVDFIEI